MKKFWNPKSRKKDSSVSTSAGYPWNHSGSSEQPAPRMCFVYASPSNFESQPMFNDVYDSPRIPEPEPVTNDVYNSPRPDDTGTSGTWRSGKSREFLPCSDGDFTEWPKEETEPAQESDQEQEGRRARTWDLLSGTWKE